MEGFYLVLLGLVYLMLSRRRARPKREARGFEVVPKREGVTNPRWSRIAVFPTFFRRNSL